MPDSAALPTPDAPDEDPRLWLEEVDGARALAWADAQTAATLARFAGPDFDADRAAIRATLDRPDNLPGIRRRGPHVYNFWRDATNPRGLWRRAALGSYRQDAPDWESLLDLDALARAEGEDWVWAGAVTLPGTHDRAMLSLSRGGADAAALREYDLPSRAFVAGGFALAEAKGGVDWLDRDTLLLSSALGDATRAGYARTVRLWSRGAAPGPALFETDAANMAVSAGRDRDSDRERIVFVERTGFIDAHVWLGDRSGAREKLDLPSDAWADWQRGWLAVRPRAPWTVGATTYAPDTVLGIGLDAFRAGERDFAVLFEPGERRALQGFFWCDGRLVLSILDELRPVFDAVTPGAWSHAALPGLPEAGVVDVAPLDVDERESDGALLVSAQDPLTPPSLLLLEPGAAAPVVLKRAPAAFDAGGMGVTRHVAVSVDGERIPYVQIGPPDATGDAPVHMTAYGGFQISMLPTYRGVTGRMWLARGGTCVIASIRGGGEFGTRWHEAGRREGKALAHEDFAAVAADLVARGVTRPGRIAAEGGSNGGLLIANMLTRFPGRFGALFCTIPLIDMRRYSRLLAGASWIAEYGDPDAPADWAFLRAISAYHAAAAGRAYPPILLATARRDDRVHPGHARKMAAKLQDLGYEALFYEPAAGGHGYGKDNAETAGFIAVGHAFMRRAIGWA